MHFPSSAVLGTAVLAAACGQQKVADDVASAPAAALADTPAPALSAAEPKSAGGRLEPRPGLWRLTLEGARATLPEACAKPEDIEALRQAQAASTGGRTCNPDNPFRREGEAWVARTKCDLLAGGRTETVMTVSGDLSARYRVEVATTYSDVPGDALPDTRIAYNAERVGDC